MSKLGLFEVDHSKARSNGLKSPLENLIEKNVIYPLIDAMSKITNKFVNQISIFSINIQYWIPNFYTFCSFTSRAIGLAALFYDKYKIAAFGFLIGYLFDCLDGYYARKYDQCTNFGCYFDHINDIIMTLLLFVISIHKRMYLTSLLIVFLGLFSVNQAIYDENHFNNSSPFFNFVVNKFENIHLLDKSFIPLFGTSTWVMLVFFSIFVKQ